MDGFGRRKGVGKPCAADGATKNDKDSLRDRVADCRKSFKPVVGRLVWVGIERTELALQIVDF